MGDKYEHLDEEEAEECRQLEEEMEMQLVEQKESLSALQVAISEGPSNPHLLPVYEELLVAIKEAEEGLFHLKRARLLREADLALQASKSVVENVETEESLNLEKVEAQSPEEDQNYPVGSKCRFHHIDGRWYDGLVEALQGESIVKVSFLKPTSEKMSICKFFLQDRCRFGANCRLSHGLDVPLSSLKKYVPTVWEQSLVGSSIWAVSDSKTGIWKKAELVSWDDEISAGKVVFREDGTSTELGSEALTLSRYAQMSDDEDEEEEESDTSSQYSDTSEYDEESTQGLGVSKIASGIQTETAIFAKWENHTRGIASKMMASMGYREGMGLGASGQGILDPISVKVLPPKQSLDHAINSHIKTDNQEKQGKKKSRGGKRKRDKKFAEAARAAKGKKEEVKSDVFRFINTQLATQGKNKKSVTCVEEPKKEDRRALVAYDHEVKELRLQIGKLEEMATRNKKEKVVYEAAMRKLNETRKALSEVETAHSSASKAIDSKEKEKKWLKF